MITLKDKVTSLKENSVKKLVVIQSTAGNVDNLANWMMLNMEETMFHTSIVEISHILLLKTEEKDYVAYLTDSLIRFSNPANTSSMMHNLKHSMHCKALGYILDKLL